jgi:hypothetical protein
MFFQNKSVGMSLPQTKTVHGVEIKKVPVGRYINALKKSEELPAVICEKCFPGESLDTVVKAFMNAEKDTVITVVGKLLVVAPELIVSVMCDIMDLDFETTINTYTPKELLDIGLAFWELNDLSDFFGRVWGLLKAMLLTQNIGYKSGSPLPKV